MLNSLLVRFRMLLLALSPLWQLRRTGWRNKIPEDGDTVQVFLPPCCS
jgi:hypothetical protein